MDGKQLVIGVIVLAGVAFGAGSSLAAGQHAQPVTPAAQPGPAQPGTEQPAAEPVGVQLDQPFTLRAGQAAALDDKDVVVRFTELVDDSRCRPGMQCIWAGEAVVAVSIAEPGRGERTTAELHTGQGGSSRTEFAARRIELVAVNQAGDEATFRISKA
ncbi:hypothetical protein [Amycolatopsis sp. NPDC059021]|uniref:hypothetical protein n=1 Tax=Amycolatopsis sp. NPDC059021 TaxID=3346704 RepID=UPI00366FD721